MAAIENIRNIGIIAHIDAGKTTTTERMLYASGKTHRYGTVDDGNTVMDYLEEERDRGITIVSAAASFPWQDALLHLIDTPGHIDFTAEVERSLRVIDGAVVIFSAVEGVEAQSEKVWVQADGYKVPRIAFINKLDRIGADFTRVVGEIDEKFGECAVPIQMPIGIEDGFCAVIDLISMTQHSDDDSQELDPEHVEEAQLWRQRMIERLADHSDVIAELYLEEAEISAEVLKTAIRELVCSNQICPVLAGASKKSIGVTKLLDAVVDYLPSPADVQSVGALSTDEEPMSVAPKADEPFAGLIFKVVASSSSDLYYIRTYSGTLKVGRKVHVPRTGRDIAVKRIVRLYSNNVEAVDSVGPGDIVGIIGPRDLVTGDTICDRHRQVLFEQMNFPEPVLTVAIEPRYSKDRDRLDQVLQHLIREDPTLTLGNDEQTGQRILSGMGELHIEINCKRIANDYNVEIKSGEPRVAYRETIKTPIEVEGVFDKVVGETELFAKVNVTLRPLKWGGQLFSVTDSSKGKSPFQAVAVKALEDGIRTGGNLGYPLIFISAELTGLETHPERTNDGAVVGAVLKGLNEAIQKAGTTLLEPIVNLNILTPPDTIGELSNYLQARRVVIHEMRDVLNHKNMICDVPLAEIFGFSKALPKLTGGRGSLSMEPNGFCEAVQS